MRSLLLVVLLPACPQQGVVRVSSASHERVVLITSGDVYYTIDTLTRLCFEGRGAVVPCEALLRDPAAAPYLTWLQPADAERKTGK